MSERKKQRGPAEISTRIMRDRDGNDAAVCTVQNQAGGIIVRCGKKYQLDENGCQHRVYEEEDL